MTALPFDPGRRSMSDFIFNGIHSSVLGCHYHPDAKARGDRTVDFAVKEITDESRDGGYYIGARAEPRAFALDCYFEDITAEQ